MKRSLFTPLKFFILLAALCIGVVPGQEAGAAAKNPDVTDITTTAGYVIQKWTTAGTGDWTIPANVTSVEYLVVAGGGGGGQNGGGGGGAGGLKTAAGFGVTPGATVTVTVGASGAGAISSNVPGSNGGSSVFSSITTTGGGGGGSRDNGGGGQAGGAGGGGGGAGGSNSNAYGAGTSGEGYNGANGTALDAGCNAAGGGGGGRGGAGYDAASTVGGLGGTGYASSITGTAVAYAGGGGGGRTCTNATLGAGGSGIGGSGGGNVTAPTTGNANTGSGGGGGGAGTGSAAGAAGIVIIKYATPAADVTDTTTYAGYTIQKWTTVGTTAWQVPAGVTNVEYLVVAGGGGGGSDRYGSGGGAGGLKTATGFAVTPGASVTVTVGAGSAGATTGNHASDGGSSVFSSISTTGGGGGRRGPGTGVTGGSGGGAASSDDAAYNGGAGTSGEGSAGGGANTYGGGGGGGKGGVGATHSVSVRGDGGAGYDASRFAITANSGYVAGGGAGADGLANKSGTPTGQAGGGNGAKYGVTDSTAAAANTGSGGGGGNSAGNGSGKNGGSGIVAVKYATPTGLFLYRRTITIGNNQVRNDADSGTTTYTNFPMLFSYTDDSFKSVANGGKISVPGTNDPYDLIFRDSTFAQLDHEIEKYDAATGEVRAWVRVPSITDGTVLYVYYGNSSITASTQKKTGVWDSDYKAVWHLKETDIDGGSGDIKDSTSNEKNGTTSGMDASDQVAGQIGGSFAFDGSNDEVTLSSVPISTNSSVTLSAWVNLSSTSLSGAFIKVGKTAAAGGGDGYGFGVGSTTVDNTGNNLIGLYEDIRWINTSSAIGTGWHYCIMVINSSGVPSFYIDGALVAGTYSGSNAKAPTTITYIGGYTSADPTNRHFNGTIDEVRLSNAARSAGWIHTEFHTQGSPSTFFTLGSETTVTAPTAVTLKSFAAREYNGAVLLQWETGYEVDNLGFHLYREEDGKLSRLTPEPVAGSGFLAGAGSAVIADRNYQWWDYPGLGGERPVGSVRYWLEDLDLNGKRTLHGPVTASLSKDPLPALANSELLSQLELQAKGAPYVQTVPDPAPGAAAGRWTDQAEPAGPGGRGLRHKAALPAQKFLAGQPAVKILVKEEGWYRVSQPELVAAGLSPRVDPRRLQLYVEGRKQAMRVSGQNDRRFGPRDAIEFYGEGLDTPATDTRVYWLVEEPGPGTRIEEHRGQGGISGPASFAHTVERKDRVIYLAALKNGEASNFFGPVVSPDAVDQILMLRHLDPAPAGPASLEVVLQGSTQVPHRVQVSVNEKKVGEVVFEGRAQGRLRVEVPQSLLHEGYNKVSLTAQGGESDYSLIEAIRLSYWHTYAADHDALKFTAPGGRQVSVAGFTKPGVQVFDVTDPHAVVEAAGRVKGGAVSFRVPGSGERTLYALSREKVKKAHGLVANKPSSWTRSAPGYELVMISHADFIQSLVPLKGLRESQGLSVALIDVADLYDELNFGNKSPQALEDFLLLAASTWRKPPRFALLVGDASLDPRNYLGFGSRDFVPTKLIDTQYLETASDDALADLDGEGLSEIAIGRLPVGTRAEAEAVVAKILSYERAGATKPVALLVADSEGEEAYDFEAASEAVAALLPRTVTVQRVFRDQYAGDDAAREALLSRIREGPLLVNYNGHGSVEEWRGDLLTTELAENLVNTRLPFFVNMTCLNGFFQDVYSQTLGEALLKAPRGGAIAVWGSSGLTDPEPQVLMNKELIRLLFGGASLTIGEAVQRAKAATADPDVRRTWILFGDPATRLK